MGVLHAHSRIYIICCNFSFKTLIIQISNFFGNSFYFVFIYTSSCKITPPNLIADSNVSRIIKSTFCLTKCNECSRSYERTNNFAKGNSWVTSSTILWSCPYYLHKPLSLVQLQRQKHVKYRGGNHRHNKF